MKLINFSNTLVKGPILTINKLLINMPIINILAVLVLIKHIFCMTLFYTSLILP